MGLLQYERSQYSEPESPAIWLLAEGVGFEPTVPYSGTPLFESGTLNHSDTLPPDSIT